MRNPNRARLFAESFDISSAEEKKTEAPVLYSLHGDQPLCASTRERVSCYPTRKNDRASMRIASALC